MRHYRDRMLLNDVLLPSGQGTTQIDHILVSPGGVFLIETKDMNRRVALSSRRPPSTGQTRRGWVTTADRGDTEGRDGDEVVQSKATFRRWVEAV